MMLKLHHAFSVAVMLVLLPLTVTAQLFETRATAAYVIDQTTGTVLLSKNATTPLPPASMSKLMTIYMAFEAIADGRLKIEEKLLVSQHAMNYGGSTMFLRAGERVTVEDLLRGVIVLSGNDASTVLAEALSFDGSEAGFARIMTERAREMGMINSIFANANGWPAANHRMSMKDLGILANRLIADFPNFYALFSEQEFAFDGRAPANSQNRNPILSIGIGADGLKTGHTSEAGYGLVGSAKQGERRIIFVITGMESAIARAEEAENIVSWGFRQFAQKDIIRAGTKLVDAAVWMGDQPSVGLTVANDLSLLVPVLGTANGISAKIVYEGPFTAPIAQGQKLGELIVTLDGLPEAQIPLIADRNVAKGGFSERIRTAAMVLWQRFAPPSQDAV